jgi:hypothetical protein
LKQGAGSQLKVYFRAAAVLSGSWLAVASKVRLPVEATLPMGPFMEADRSDRARVTVCRAQKAAYKRCRDVSLQIEERAEDMEAAFTQ